MNLRKYRWHVGTTPFPCSDSEPRPLLYRDVGLEGLDLFLRDKLRRLAGPLSPVTYVRTSAYREPYVDEENTARLVVLPSSSLPLWHSGQKDIYLLPADIAISNLQLALAPGDVPRSEIDHRLQDACSTMEAREALGGQIYDEYIHEHREHIHKLLKERSAQESFSSRLRRQFQSGCAEEQARIREWLLRHDLSENDLTAAFHHVPRKKRNILTALARATSKTNTQDYV